MRKVFGIALTGFVICVVVAVIFGVIAFYLYPSLGEAIKPYIRTAYKSMPVRICCTIPIPPEHGTLVFLRHGIHPSLAPYEYKLKITKGSTVLERPLPSNGRSQALVNTYWYPASQHGGPWVRFQDREGEYLLDMKDQKVLRILRYKGHVFAGELSSGRDGIAVVESGGKILVSVGRKDAYEIAGTPVGDSSGKYIGRIEGNYYRLRFITPGQTPEQKIRGLE